MGAMIVLKFGGAILDGPDGARRVVEEVARVDGDALIVLSAFGGMTNRLEVVAETATRDPEEATDLLRLIVEDYRAVASALLDDDALSDWERSITTGVDHLHDLIRGLSITGELSPRTLDLVVHYGEIFSSATIAAALAAERIAAPDLLITDDRHRFAAIRPADTRRRVEERLGPIFSGEESTEGRRLVVTEGYIARSESGEITTMGRETSDYSAALFGAILGASEVRIYTAVPGVLTADPKLCAEARTIERMSYGMAREIARLGAKVIHPRTVRPVEEEGIRLVLCDLDGRGTTIERSAAGDAVSFPLLRNVGLIRCDLRGTTGRDDDIMERVRRFRPIIRALRVGRSLSILVDGYRAELASELLAAFPERIVSAEISERHLISGVREAGWGVSDASRFLECLESHRVVTYWGDPDERSVSALVATDDPEGALGEVHRQFLPS